MQLSEITKHLEQLAPLAYAEDFDNVGLLVSHTNDITGILVCHDALEEVIEEAILKKCNLVVCFHPIFWNKKNNWKKLCRTDDYQSNKK